MNKIKIIKIETSNGLEDHIIIDHGNDEFTSMPKTIYDKQQALNELDEL